MVKDGEPIFHNLGGGEVADRRAAGAKIDGRELPAETAHRARTEAAGPAEQLRKEQEEREKGPRRRPERSKIYSNRFEDYQ